jgi:hypothetical protein
MEALHETAGPIAAKSVRDVIIFDIVTAGARPAIAEGGERAHPHANAAGVLEGSVIKAEGGSVGDSIEPHAAGSGGDAVEKGPGGVCWQKAQQLLAAGGIKGAADLGWQPSELCSGYGSEALTRRGA